MRTLAFAGFLLAAAAATAKAQQEQKSAVPEIPADQRPPKGMCRIWLLGVPAAQQSAPTDCTAAVKNCPPNGRVIFGDTEEAKGKRTADTTGFSAARKSTPMTKSFADPKKSNPLTKPPVVPPKPPA